MTKCKENIEGSHEQKFKQIPRKQDLESLDRAQKWRNRDRESYTKNTERQRQKPDEKNKYGEEKEREGER